MLKKWKKCSIHRWRVEPWALNVFWTILGQSHAFWSTKVDYINKSLIGKIESFVKFILIKFHIQIFLTFSGYLFKNVDFLFFIWCIIWFSNTFVTYTGCFLFQWKSKMWKICDVWDHFIFQWALSPYHYPQILRIGYLK